MTNDEDDDHRHGAQRSQQCKTMATTDVERIGSMAMTKNQSGNNDEHILNNEHGDDLEQWQ